MTTEERRDWLNRLVDDINRLVRPVLAFWFGAAVLFFTYMAYLTPDAFLAIAGMVIGFFFRGRDDEKRDEKREDRIIQEQDRLRTAVHEMIPQARAEARQVIATEAEARERRE